MVRATWTLAAGTSWYQLSGRAYRWGRQLAEWLFMHAPVACSLARCSNITYSVCLPGFSINTLRRVTGLHRGVGSEEGMRPPSTASAASCA